MQRLLMLVSLLAAVGLTPPARADQYPSRPITVIVPLTAGTAVDVVALDRALDALAKVDARKSRIVELRFFGGLSVEETAAVLHVSTDTVKRDWRLAKLRLLRELEGEGA